MANGDMGVKQEIVKTGIQWKPRKNRVFQLL